jgi:hypothetical protein
LHAPPHPEEEFRPAFESGYLSQTLSVNWPSIPWFRPDPKSETVPYDDRIAAEASQSTTDRESPPRDRDEGESRIAPSQRRAGHEFSLPGVELIDPIRA